MLTRSRRKFSPCSLLFLFAFIGLLRAGDWPRWRGPDLNGISQETNWLAKWPDDGPKQLWKASVGIGFSSITVSRGRAYTMGGSSNDVDTVCCLDAETGAPVWQFSYPSPLDPQYFEGGPGATPTVDGDRVYTLGRSGDLFCFDAVKGVVVWSNNVAEATGATMPTWGFASSPLVEGEMLVLNAGKAGAALDKRTGRVLWSSGTNAGGYATPMPFNSGTNRLLAIFAFDTLEAVQASDGHSVWSFPWKTEYDVNAATPIIEGDRVFISSSYSQGGALLKITGNHPVVVWQNKNLQTQFSSSVLWQGCLYGASDIGSGDMEKCDLKCVDWNTGEVRWSVPDFGKGGLMIAGGRLLALSAKGELFVAEPSPAEFKVISRAQVLGGKCWTVPTLANGRIYCRNARGDLVCLDVRAPRASP